MKNTHAKVLIFIIPAKCFRYFLFIFNLYYANQDRKSSPILDNADCAIRLYTRPN